MHAVHVIARVHISRCRRLRISYRYIGLRHNSADARLTSRKSRDKYR